MDRDDFIRAVGAGSTDSDYLPVAFLLRAGYGCVGYFNADVNEGFDDACVLLNARLIEITASSTGSTRPSIHDFGEFLEEVVGDYEVGRSKASRARATSTERRYR
jgi:hypothetical protein